MSKIPARSFRLAIVSAALASALCPPLVRPVHAGKTHQVLFFTKSSGYEHSVIHENSGKPSHAEKVLRELGAKNGFEITHTTDGRVFTPETLAKYDVIFFQTTGDLTTLGEDKNPPMSPAGKEALLGAIRKGKGFVGTHNASDTFHGKGTEIDPYIQMLGGEFVGHGDQAIAKLLCADPKFPGAAIAKGGLEILDEWYTLKNFAPDLHVVLYQATWSLKNTGYNSLYRRGPYPMTWVHPYGKGRVFYTSMGHREDVWTHPAFQTVLVGGIKWAAGAVVVNITPNLTTVTPYHAELPPWNPPPAAPPPARAP